MLVLLLLSVLWWFAGEPGEELLQDQQDDHVGGGDRETPRPFTKDLPTGAAGFTLTASAVTETIAVEDWSAVPADQVFVITGFLAYGTAGSVTLIELKDGQQSVHAQRNAVEANAQNINQKKVPLSYPVGPGHAMRLYFTAGAAPPADNRVYLEGVFFHVTEL